MPDDQTTPRRALTDRERMDNLRDALVEDILAMSDEELLAEAAEDGWDVEAEAARFSEIFERAKQEVERRGKQS